MLSVQNLSKKFGIDPILSKITFTVHSGERVGLVGPNGCGKTTLLRIIMGEEHLDEGSVQFLPSDLKVGYLRQGFQFSSDETISFILPDPDAHSAKLSSRLQTLAVTLAVDPGDLSVQQQYDLALSEIKSVNESGSKSSEVIKAFELDHLPFDFPVRLLSGGQKTRLALARILLDHPRLLILDEPTNHLDIKMLEWLEAWLRSFDGGVLLVSHDRQFLDGVVTRILEIDQFNHEMKAYDGNYSAYIEQKQAAREKQWNAYTDQQDEIKRLRRAARVARESTHFHKGGKADPAVTDGFAAGFFKDRSLETIKKAKKIEKRVDALMNEDHIDKPKLTWEMRIEFSSPGQSGRDVVVFENTTIGYSDLTLLQNLKLTLKYGHRTALIGPNGSGKTTLFKTILGEIPSLGGSVRVGSNVHAGIMTQEQFDLPAGGTPLSLLSQLLSKNQTEVRNYLSKYLFKGDDVFKQIERLSFGERARLSLARLVASGCNLLLLDEPINHLDIPSRAQFEQSLSGFRGTILAAVHDRYFINQFATQIWEIKDHRIQVREKL